MRREIDEFNFRVFHSNPRLVWGIPKDAPFGLNGFPLVKYFHPAVTESHGSVEIAAINGVPPLPFQNLQESLEPEFRIHRMPIRL